jgi:hypothetical protein
MFTAQKTQRPDLEAKAQEHAIKLLRDANWADREVWVDNRFHVRRLLGSSRSGCSVTAAAMRSRISASVLIDAVHPTILLGISQQSEQRDRHDCRRLLGIDVHIEELPTWFPTSEAVAEIRRQHPDLQPGNLYDNQGNGDVAAQVLYIESRSQ